MRETESSPPPTPMRSPRRSRSSRPARPSRASPPSPVVMVLTVTDPTVGRLATLQFCMASAGAFSWNSELPSGHNPFWIRDEALSGLGLHPGDAVSVDTRAEAHDGDLVVVEVELDGDSLRTARRFQPGAGERIRLEAVGSDLETLELAADKV